MRHTEKLTHKDLYCLADWVNQQSNFIVILFAYKQKKNATVYIPLLSLYCQLNKQRWVPWNMCPEKGSKKEKFWKATQQTEVGSLKYVSRKGFQKGKVLKSNSTNRSGFPEMCPEKGSKKEKFWKATQQIEVGSLKYVSRKGFQKGKVLKSNSTNRGGFPVPKRVPKRKGFEKQLNKQRWVPWKGFQKGKVLKNTGLEKNIFNATEAQ